MSSTLSGFLGEMARRSRARVELASTAVPYESMRHRALAQGPTPALAVGRNGFDLIAEVKLHSPSAGAFVAAGAEATSQVTAQARAYEKAGAAAISVLTESTEFAGSLAHMSWVREVTSTPVLRKDFIVDRYQVVEARAAGASGILLISTLR